MFDGRAEKSAPTEMDAPKTEKKQSRRPCDINISHGHHICKYEGVIMWNYYTLTN